MFLTSTRTITEGKDAVIIAEYEDDMVAVFHPSSECVGIYIRDEDDASVLLSVGSLKRHAEMLPIELANIMMAK
jgi:hypothetical protein